MGKKNKVRFHDKKNKKNQLEKKRSSVVNEKVGTVLKQRNQPYRPIRVHEVKTNNHSTIVEKYEAKKKQTKNTTSSASIMTERKAIPIAAVDSSSVVSYKCWSLYLDCIFDLLNRFTKLPSVQFTDDMIRTSIEPSHPLGLTNRTFGYDCTLTFKPNFVLNSNRIELLKTFFKDYPYHHQMRSSFKPASAYDMKQDSILLL